MDRLKSWIISVKSKELHDMALTTLCLECIRMVDTSHCFFLNRSVLCILDRRLHIFVVKAWLINHFEKYFTFYIVLHHTIQYLVRESITFMKHDWNHIIFKQEARGSHRLLEKKFQPINRFAQSYTITLIKREKKTHYILFEKYDRKWSSFLFKAKSALSKDALCQV